MPLLEMAQQRQWLSFRMKLQQCVFPSLPLGVSQNSYWHNLFIISHSIVHYSYRFTFIAILCQSPFLKPAIFSVLLSQVFYDAIFVFGPVKLFPLLLQTLCNSYVFIRIDHLYTSSTSFCGFISHFLSKEPHGPRETICLLLY